VLVPGEDDFDTFDILPPAAYAIKGDGITGTQLSFAAGEAVKEMAIDLDPTNLSFTTQYALPIRISNATNGYNVSNVLSTAVIQVIVKNKYDGKYTLSMSSTGWSAYGIYDNSTEVSYGPIALVTAGSDKVVFDNLQTGTSLEPGLSYDPDSGAIGVTQFGAASPTFGFDADDKLIFIDNVIPDDGRGRDFLLNPNAPVTSNLWDPATKTFKASFIMKQNGRPDQLITWTAKYAGAR
jgi:hypothetical protein